MAGFIAITLQAEVRGRPIWSTKLNVWSGTKVPVLRELVEDVFHAKGTLNYQEKNINQKIGTLDELQVGNGGVLKIKNYQKMSNEKLKATQIEILQEGWCTIELPQKIKVRLLKFLIECKQKILISHQVINKSGQRWEEDANATYECTREELQQLQVEDISKRQSTPPHYSPTTDTRSLPMLFPAAERDPQNSIDTDSSGSDSNLDDGGERGRDAAKGVAVAKGEATNQSTCIAMEEESNPDKSKPQYSFKRPTKSDINVVHPLSKKNQALAQPKGEPKKNYLVTTGIG